LALFGLLLGLLALLFLLGMLGVLLAGIIWFAYQLNKRQVLAFALARATCIHCGELVQTSWRHCPNCGQPLAEATVDNLTAKSLAQEATVHA
jgi:hypothetical protein